MVFLFSLTMMVSLEKFLMDNIDLLIAIRKEMYGAVCNYGLKAVFTEEQWKEFVYKCVCNGITEEQIEALEKNGISRDKIYDLLGVGKDCGTCVKGEKIEEAD